MTLEVKAILLSSLCIQSTIPPYAFTTLYLPAYHAVSSKETWVKVTYKEASPSLFLCLSSLKQCVEMEEQCDESRVHVPLLGRELPWRGFPLEGQRSGSGLALQNPIISLS